MAILSLQYRAFDGFERALIEPNPRFDRRIIYQNEKANVQALKEPRPSWGIAYRRGKAGLVDKTVEARCIYQVRESLEELAARLAAPRLTTADLVTLDRLKAEMEQAATVNDFDAHLNLHREFRFTIYRAAGRRRLMQLIAQLWDLSARYRRFQLYAFPERVHTSLFETQAILDACHRRDPEALACMVRYKVHQTVVSLLDVMRREMTTMVLKHGNRQ
ncbi:GntR family transcriptional regulator [Roseiflexus sp.]|uniref:GntR family transcriptional regulator n=1 Tax=Roseiflexus sp. TaxID=2562120 RepID=UPI00398B8B79